MLLKGVMSLVVFLIGLAQADLRSAWMPQLKQSDLEKIKRNSKRFIRKMAKDHGVVNGIMHSHVTKYLGCSSYRMQKRQVLSEATEEKRLDRGWKMLTVLMSGTKPAIIFVPEGVMIIGTVY